MTEAPYPSRSEPRQNHQDEDQIFDDFYAAADAARIAGACNPFGLSEEELDWLDDEGDEPTDEDVEERQPTVTDDENGDFGSGSDDDDDEQDQSAGERTCDRCGGSGFEPGGDGAQCDDCHGKGVIPSE